jgi:hypothetical protein
MTKPAATAKPLHIFKPGRWTSMAGEAIDFSLADLQATAAAFDPALGKAPIVIGHPATDDPAQGWTKQLKATERGLFAVPEKVDPAFAQAANEGRWGAVSAKFYRPTDPNNPVPGVWYLRHIGMLGAQNPAVKGLDDPAFADAQDDGCVCFQESVAFSGWDGLTVAGLFRNLREWVIGKFGAEEADKVLPSYELRSLELSAQDDLRQDALKSVAEFAAAPAPAFSDPHHQPENPVPLTPEQIAAIEAENKKLKEQLAQAAADKAKEQTARLHAANVAFCEAIPANKLLPAWRGVAVATLDTFAAQPAVVEFGEGDAKAPLADKFKEFLKALPESVAFGEHATNSQAGAPQDKNPLLADAEERASAK